MESALCLQASMQMLHPMHFPSFIRTNFSLFNACMGQTSIQPTHFLLFPLPHEHFMHFPSFQQHFLLPFNYALEWINKYLFEKTIISINSLFFIIKWHTARFATPMTAKFTNFPLAKLKR